MVSLNGDHNEAESEDVNDGNGKEINTGDTVDDGSVGEGNIDKDSVVNDDDLTSVAPGGTV